MARFKLAAIMFTDIVGYTALMGKDTEKALALLHINREIQKPLIDKYEGVLLKEMGDGMLAQFNSAIDSVRCAMEIQQMARSKLDAPLRIGIHLGDVTTENGDVFGDGVNIASRLQAISDPGGIYISDSIEHAIRGNKEISTGYIGAIQLKNVDYRVPTYYLTGEGLTVPSRTKKEELCKREHRSVFRSYYTYVAVLIIVVMGVLAGIWIKNKTESRIKGIVVLPVEIISGGEDQMWLTAGIHHGLIDELSKIKAYRVISRLSSMKYANTGMTAPEIARELKVNGIITCSFYTDDDNLHVQVRLIQALPKERQLWGKDFNISIKEVYSLFDEVARSIATATDITLSPEEKIYLSGKREVDPRAYEAYLRGMEHVENATKADLDQALNYFNAALEIDPEFAPAYSGIYLTWASYAQHGFLSSHEGGLKAKEALNKALELDSTLVEVRGWDAILSGYSDNWPEAEQKFEKVLDINPNYSPVLAYYGHLLIIMGYFQEGLTHSNRAIEIDPYNDLIQAIHAMNLKNLRMYNEALAQLNILLNTEPEHGIGLPVLWAVYHEMGRYPEALEVAHKIYSVKGNNVAMEALESGYEEGGYAMAMKRTAEAMIAYRDSTFFPAWQIGTLYSRAGLKREAIDWLWKAYEEQDGNLPVLSVDPLFDDLRDDPRFQELLARLNLPKIARFQ